MCLSENLRQRHGGDHAAFQQVTQHIARPHRGQLIAVAHQNEAAAGAQCMEQRRHQLQIHHAHLIHDDGIAFQRLFFILAEIDLARQLIVTHAQGAVDGLGITGTQLTHPLGSASRRGKEQHGKTHPLKKGHNPANSGGLTGTGAARQHQYPLLRRQSDGVALQGRIDDTLLHLNFTNNLPCIHPMLTFLGAGRPQALCHIGLRLVHTAEITALHIGNGAADNFALLTQVVHGFFHRVAVHINELRRGRHQLITGQEHMAVAQIMAQLIQHRRLHAAIIVAAEAHGDGDLVGGGKFHAEAVIGKEIGVILQRGYRVLPIGTHQGHGHGNRQLIAAQKLRHAAQSR